MNKIPDFTEQELQIIHDTLQKRYSKDVATEQADIELGVNPDDNELSECPAIYWEHGSCHFILAKTGEQQFFSQFFYGNGDHFGTGKQFYDDVLDCLITTLRVQADHELKKAGVIGQK